MVGVSAAIAVSIAASFAGCTNSQTGESELLSLTAVVPDIAAPNQMVTINEGTNMALTQSPVSGDFVDSIQGTLFSIPASGGKATPLTDYYQDAREPQFSSDGTQVVYHGYAAGNWDIYSLGITD